GLDLDADVPFDKTAVPLWGRWILARDLRQRPDQERCLGLQIAEDDRHDVRTQRNDLPHRRMTHDLTGVGKKSRVRVPLRFELAEALFNALDLRHGHFSNRCGRHDSLPWDWIFSKDSLALLAISPQGEDPQGSGTFQF